MGRLLGCSKNLGKIREMINRNNIVNFPLLLPAIVNSKIFSGDLYEIVHLCSPIKYFRGPIMGAKGGQSGS